MAFKNYLVLIFSLAIISCNNGDSKTEKKGNSKIKSQDFKLTDISKETNLKTLLAQNWENKEDAADFKASNGSSSFEMPYRGFSLFSDKALLKNPRDEIKFGKWDFDEANKTLNFSYNDGSKENFKLAALGPKEMVLLNPKDNSKTTYSADAKVEKVLTNDPFYPENNLWRVKPKHAESDSALKERLLSIIQFYQKYMNDVIARGGNSISFGGLPVIFKWYNGGIGTILNEKLSPKMINCFYNREQAEKANLILQDLIQLKYQWDKDEPVWVKQDIGVLGQMYDSLKIAK